MPFTYLYIEDNFVPDIVTDQFRRKKIGVGITLKEGENMDDAIAEAEKFIKEYVVKNTVFTHTHIEENCIYQPSALPTIQYEPPTICEVREQTLEEQIRSCTEKKVLESYKFIAKKDPQLQKAYNDTLSTIELHKL